MENSTELEKLTEVKDDQLDSKLDELSQKPVKTEDDKKKVDDLKREKSSRAEKRITELQSQLKEMEYKYGRKSDESEELRERIAALEENMRERSVEVVADKKTVKVGSKEFYTDEALIGMVKSGELSEDRAYKIQRERDKAEAVEEAVARLKTDSGQEEERRVRSFDARKVLDEYPHFDKNNRNFNPEDPLYQETTRIWTNGYRHNPNGLSLALAEAKKILRIADKNPDISDELSLSHSAPPKDKLKKEREITLDENEREAAYRMYRDLTNPGTGRKYTLDESVNKYKKAKEARLSRRVA